MTSYLIILVILILVYAFLNGFHDSCTVVATMIASRATSTKIALVIAAIGNLAGPFILGTAVAKTLGEGLFNLYAFKIEAILFALISAIAWSLLTWLFAIPSSSSHTIIGAMIGASIIFNGIASIKLAGLYKIIIFLLLIEGLFLFHNPLQKRSFFLNAKKLFILFVIFIIYTLF